MTACRGPQPGRISSAGARQGPDPGGEAVAARARSATDPARVDLRSGQERPMATVAARQTARERRTVVVPGTPTATGDGRPLIAAGRESASSSVREQPTDSAGRAFRVT